MAVDITLARCFDEHHPPVMQLPYKEKWTVVHLIDAERQHLYCPLLHRLARAEYGAEDDVVYGPKQVGILKGEIENVIGFVATRKDSETLPVSGGPTTVGEVRAFLNELLAVIEEAMRDGKGLFAWAD